MALLNSRDQMLIVIAALAITTSVAVSQSTPPIPVGPATPASPATPATPTAPPSPITGIRNKVSAGDLLSAESILEVYRAKNGEDGTYLTALSWLARGALLVGEADKAKRYAAAVRARCADSIAHGVDIMNAHELETALGAAIEVQAQLIERTKGRRAAADAVRAELAKLTGPVPLVSRLNKRINMLALAGTPAPEIKVEDFVGDQPPTLASLAGRPVLIFVWAATCGDCKAQEATLARVKTRYSSHGLQILALTRYYDADVPHATEKAQVDSVWKAVYADMGATPIIFSTESMERYGGSSTPTFVFVDRKGIVREYTPTRLTEPEFDRALARIMK